MAERKDEEKMSMIVFKVPRNSYLSELNYIIEVLQSSFLGLDYIIEVHNNDKIVIKLREESDKDLVIENILFNISIEKWLTESSLPLTPLPQWDVSVDLPELKFCNKKLPVIYGRKLSNGRYIQQGENYLHLGLDVFGSCFFMLTRYEEIVMKERDEHERFPAKASLAYKEGFLLRPIVNEYVEVLWASMKRLWPGLNRKQHSYKVLLTHDIDHPFMVCNQSWYQLFRNIGGDILKRRDFGLAIQRWKCKNQNNPELDPANTFDFIMDLSEKYGLKSEFYFMTDHTAGSLDGSNYSLDSPDIKVLMSKIYKRGHTIGFHASYNTFRDSQRTKKEFEKLIVVAEKLGIKQDSWGGRQHYLRWENPTTWQNWNDAGLNYDSTLSFADYVGFRTGTCYEYTVFNILKRRILQLKERPLIVMDCTLSGENYMNLEKEDSLMYIKQLSLNCKKFGGNFVILWHNTSLVLRWQRSVYQEILKLL
jgi:hypothetical protein